MAYPEDKAIKVWSWDAATFSILQHPKFGHYCGYVRFPQRFLIETGYHGLVTYNPVHGGITYAEEHSDCSMVYGFDCGHYDDEGNPDLSNIDWLTKECEKMARCLLIIKDYEDDYLHSENNEARADVLKQMHQQMKEELGAEFSIPDNFGAMINILFGQL